MANLSKIAKAELDKKRESYGIEAVMDLALQKTSPDGRTYQQRLDRLRTERELSDLYEDMIREIPLGAQLAGGQNPVRTGGSTQVSIAFAADHMREKPYPWKPAGSARGGRQAPRRPVFRRGDAAGLSGVLQPHALPLRRLQRRHSTATATRR